MTIPKEVARLSRSVAALERRVENMFRQGAVSDVDTEKQRVRLVVGKGPDGVDQKSPWVPYAQQAGALKIHAPPSFGQNMTMLSPGGDIEQAVALPMTWNNGNASPSQSASENVLTFGDVTIKVTESEVRFQVGGFVLSLSAAGFGAAGGSMAHDGKNIGATHIHTNVEPGPGNSGPPTGGGPVP